MEFEYTTILVKDMEKSLDFYMNTLGFKMEKQLNLENKTINFLKSENGSGVELIKEDNPDIGLYGLAFHVEDVRKEAQVLKEDNPELEIAIEETPNTTLAFIKDPNGVNIVLSQ